MSDADAPPPRRTGPLWKTYRALYWTFTIGLGASVSLSVTWHAVKAAGGGGVVASEPRSAAACDAELARLYTDLRREGSRLLSTPTPHVSDTWHTWSETWRGQYEDMRARCTGPTATDREAVRKRAKDLERVHLAYTTAFRGFTEVGRRPLRRIQKRPGGAP